MPFDAYLSRWDLTPDGDPIATRTSRLLPVRRAGAPAMLKIAMEEEEQRGGRLMVWWAGEGAARVLAHDGPALLLERAMGGRSLAGMARNGWDDEASRIICAAAAKLHAARRGAPPPLVPLARWFGELDRASARNGGVFRLAAATARELLAEPQDIAVLHGDIHHGNVLDAGRRGWLAIDPKGLVGERGFDFANIFRNPSLDVAAAPGRMARQTAVVAEAAGLDRGRLVKWVLAYAGLSAAWQPSDGALSIAEFAAVEAARLR